MGNQFIVVIASLAIFCVATLEARTQDDDECGCNAVLIPDVQMLSQQSVISDAAWSAMSYETYQVYSKSVGGGGGFSIGGFSIKGNASREEFESAKSQYFASGGHDLDSSSAISTLKTGLPEDVVAAWSACQSDCSVQAAGLSLRLRDIGNNTIRVSVEWSPSADNANAGPLVIDAVSVQGAADSTQASGLVNGLKCQEVPVNGHAVAFLQREPSAALSVIAQAGNLQADRSLAPVVPQPVPVPSIIGVSIPDNSMDDYCWPICPSGVYDGCSGAPIWSVTAPAGGKLPASSGIGYIVNSASPISPEFALHDHHVVSYRPDPSRAVVTYEFSQPATVSQLEVVQHLVGINQIEGFVGNDLGSMVSIGVIFSQLGDIQDQSLAEYRHDIFEFDNTISGRYFRFVITRTIFDFGVYAVYRAYPRDTAGQRIPTEPTVLPAPVVEAKPGAGASGECALASPPEQTSGSNGDDTSNTTTDSSGSSNSNSASPDPGSAVPLTSGLCSASFVSIVGFMGLVLRQYRSKLRARDNAM